MKFKSTESTTITLDGKCLILNAFDTEIECNEDLTQVYKFLYSLDDVKEQPVVKSNRRRNIDLSQYMGKSSK